MPDIIKDTEDFVVELLTTQLNANYLYHNLRHTQRVVKITKELLEAYDLDEKENEIITLAAWLHDTGYTQGYENHEKKSAAIASKFLAEKNYSSHDIQQVQQLIMATNRHHTPTNLSEDIIKDADTSHLGSSNYAETSELLREELFLLGIAEFTPQEWDQENIKMLGKEHRFYTGHAKKQWQETKTKNLNKLIKREAKHKRTASKEKLKVKLKNESPERGIQTMFRVAMQNHLKLSDIADTKANILLSVNAIIISLLLTNLIPKMDSPKNEFLIYPTSIFILFSVVSMIMSIMATRPNITRGEFTKEDVKQKKVNLLFFGNFHKMELQDFEWAIQEMIKDQDYVYNSLTKDLYFLGLVLDRKYKLLRWTYTIFMIGMILSVVAFFISFNYHMSLL
ncbi:Pycsar system effector family protein [Arenibacter latericius]|uniref:Pycsar system effector family protein n=1 Tax=Arenibacter latericius TaxID=86104 RepID=UPI00041F9D8C|nr:Pycsar system effector family protein [Arenibacter latericius]MDX1362740.1 DUF5706 domain-containing protein [Arenibacter latericius]